jgi:hypothetical protein
MALTPSFSYSRFETHIFLNVSKEAKMEPLGTTKKNIIAFAKVQNHLTYPIHVE